MRDAVKAARGALPGWQGRTAYNRGQILYRFAEALESRIDELTGETVRLRGLERAAARREIEAAVDHAVHYAGWTDKLHAVLGAVNPVAAPHFNFTFPEPTGVVGVIAPDEPDVLGLVAEILPPLAAGNVVVAIVSERWPLLAAAPRRGARRRRRPGRRREPAVRPALGAASSRSPGTATSTR